LVQVLAGGHKLKLTVVRGKPEQAFQKMGPFMPITPETVRVKGAEGKGHFLHKSPGRFKPVTAILKKNPRVFFRGFPRGGRIVRGSFAPGGVRRLPVFIPRLASRPVLGDKRAELFDGKLITYIAFVVTVRSFL